MHQISWKKFGALAFVILLFVQIFIIFFWTSRNKIKTKNEYIFSYDANIQDIKQEIFKTSVPDSSGDYKVHLHTIIIDGKNLNASIKNNLTSKQANDVTLVTQCSLSNLHFLPELTKQWQGPISVAIFLSPVEIISAIFLLKLLSHCYLDMKQNVYFSIVYPAKSDKENKLLAEAVEKFLKKYKGHVECDYIPLLWQHLEQPNYSSETEFPVNLLRNTARRATQTRYFLVLDIDMSPSEGLRLQFLLLLNSKNISQKATAWVLPSYELQRGIRVPSSKKDLLFLVQSRLARPFYQELCWKCQKHTRYDLWEKTSSDDVGPLFEVDWHDPWEPFYISHSDAPFYDERFRQYGFNRISQVCEMHIRGYHFVVLEGAFVCHAGFKKTGHLHASKYTDLERNRKLFRRFKQELKVKIPQSQRRCY